MGRDDRFLLAALGFSATSTIALAAVLLAFAVTGGFTLLKDSGDPVSRLSLHGVDVALKRIGLADELCVEADGASYLYTAPGEGKLAYAVVEISPRKGSSAMISYIKLEKPGGGVASPIAPVALSSEGCSAQTSFSDVEPYTGGPLTLESPRTVIVVFSVDATERSGTIVVGLSLKDSQYEAEFAIERCRVAWAKIGYKAP